MTKDEQNAALLKIEEKISALEADYTRWWIEDITAHPQTRLIALKEAQEFAMQKFEAMSLGEQDAYSCQVDSWLPVVNSFIPTLQKYYDELKALIGMTYTIAGLRGDPYKDQVTGEPRLTKQHETLQLAERLSTSITKQSGSIVARNYRIGAEIKSGIYSGNVQNLGGDKVQQRTAVAAGSLRQM